MRIIAGEFRGRRLLAPTGDSTRPITDRAKQSLFDILAPSIPGANVLDVFAGTGSMGLECLSRGAGNARFFEKDRPAVDALRKNISALQVGNRSQVITTDVFSWFSSAAAADLRPTDLIFLDPPYRFLRERSTELQNLAGQLGSRLTPGGLVIFRHDAADSLDLPPLHQDQTRSYGSMVIEFLRLSGTSI